MSNLILQQQNGESPFDSIRHLDGQGSEFWSARELMPILGYKMWQKFKAVIDNAAENIETLTGSTVQHFLPVEIKSQGRPSLDLKLSRLACYHIALSCDSRGNSSVKAAKHYFAIKTREAETIIPRQIEVIKELELRLALAQAETQRAIAEKAVLDTRHLIVATCPEPVQQKIFGYEVIKEVEYRDRIVKDDDLINDGSTINKTQLCKRYGILTKNGKPDFKKLNNVLMEAQITDDPDAWQMSATLQEVFQLKREYLPSLDQKLLGRNRQLWLGE